MKNINYVVSLVQMDLHDYTTHEVSRILQYCIHCYKNVLLYKTNKSVEVAYLKPNEANNAPWPKDYEYYTKMAVNIGGQLLTLTLNPDIPLTRRYECGDEKKENYSDDLLKIDPFLYTYGYYYAPHYRDGMYVGEMYSMGGGFNEAGYFRVDYGLQQFQFYNVPRTTIILEYVADKNVNGATLIQNADVEVMRSYVHWQLLEHNRKIPANEKERKLGLFNAALQTRIHIANALTISDYLDNTYSTLRSGPKR